MKKKLLFLISMLFLNTALYAQSITITAPAAETSYKVADDVVFEWDHADLTTTELVLMLSIDGGSTYSAASASFNKDDASVSFSIPVDVDAGDYYFKIKEVATVIESASIKLVLDESIKVNIDKSAYNTLESIVFTWQNTPEISMLEIRMSTDGGGTFDEVISDENIDASLGTYSLQIPAGAQSGDYYIVMKSTTSAVLSNTVDAALIDMYSASEVYAFPEDGSKMKSDLSNNTYYQKLVIEFDESIKLVANKMIYLKSDDTNPVTNIAFNTDDATVTVQNESNLEIDPAAHLPLVEGASYYIQMGDDVVTDLAGNAFGGFTDEWTFTAESGYSITGQINYSGTIEGDLVIVVFTQADFDAQDASNPLSMISDPDPMFPRGFDLAPLEDGTYVIIAYRDSEAPEGYDPEKDPVIIEQNIVIDGASVNRNLTLADPTLTTNFETVAKNKIQVRASGIVMNETIKVLKVYSVTGNLILKRNNLDVGTVVNTSGWKSGIYIVDADGTITKTIK